MNLWQWLHLNPWSDRRFLEHVAGAWETRQALKTQGVTYIRTSVGALSAGRPVHLYAVTPRRARAQGLPYPTAGFAARVALMSIGRLRRARERILGFLPPRFEVDWMASPVVLNRDMYPLDAIVALKKKGEGAEILLTTWLLAPRGAGLSFFEYAARSWRKIQEQVGLPMLLVIDTESRLHSPASQRYLLEVFGGKGVLLLASGRTLSARWGVKTVSQERSVWMRNLLGYKPAPRAGWSNLSAQAQAAWEGQGAVRGQKRYLRLLYPVVRQGALPPTGLNILRWIVRYPEIPLELLSDILQKNASIVARYTRALQTAGLIQSPAKPVATEEGTALLAALQGVPPGVLQRYRYVGNARAVRGKSQHTESIYRFFECLRERKQLLTFAVEPPPFRFAYSRGRGLYRVMPDGIGVLVQRRPRAALVEFWLEVDRGTLSKSRLQHKVLRVFQAARARMSDIPANLRAMVFLVAIQDALKAENRVQVIRRALEQAYVRAPAPLVVAVGRSDRVCSQNRAWQGFRYGQWHSEYRSLEEVIGRAA